MFKSLVIALAVLFAIPAVAQPVTSPCPGKMAAIRVSEIKPGKEAIAEKAVADHRAWYVKRNMPTTVERLQVLKMVPGSGPALDASKMMTITTYASIQRPGDDDEWKAFVAEYNDSTTMVSEMRVCMN